MSATQEQTREEITMELQENQAALILETSEDGGITVDIRAKDDDGLAAAICAAIGEKLLTDEQFQQTIFNMVYGDEE